MKENKRESEQEVEGKLPCAAVPSKKYFQHCAHTGEFLEAKDATLAFIYQGEEFFVSRGAGDEETEWHVTHGPTGRAFGHLGSTPEIAIEKGWSRALSLTDWQWDWCKEEFTKFPLAPGWSLYGWQGSTNERNTTDPVEGTSDVETTQSSTVPKGN